MKLKILSFLIVISLSSCIVTTKRFAEMENSYQNKLNTANEKLGTTEKKLTDYTARFDNSDKEFSRIQANYEIAQNTIKIRDEQVQDLKSQVADFKKQRDIQMSQVGDLTALSQTATTNIKETLSQLDKKDKYIQLIQAAKQKLIRLT